MKHASIEREIRIEAAPDVVYKVVSAPEHVREWWPDEAAYTPAPGGTGVIAFGEEKCVPLTVLEADPPKLFRFRWAYGEGEVATPENSFLVTFELIPDGAGTLLRFSETGFTEKYAEDAERAQEYDDHVNGWNHFLPRLVAYAGRLVSSA
ncbi:SRPBCC domain-containing protein [Streptomyces sp. TRM66268-LWL]|uniref:SRPBCC domain-containing protein n=1 Tax=Streptomyces polyasparticus TaxID=2767826 RepID=A0ABR7SDE6_9ACTN|nr:SRPBCC domain-containing protein [Streptomyces polyasparticus]MBC9713521.1 SRPBCC domain-containing protein [Streptomyces polyasparticus]